MLYRSWLSVVVCGLTVSVFAQEPVVKPKPTTWLPAPSPVEAKTRIALERRCEISFQQTPLSDAIRFLEDIHNAPFQIDVPLLPGAKAGDEASVTLESANISFRDALKSILAQHELTYVIDEEAVKVVNVNVERNRLLTRTYPIADLVERENVDAIVKSIKDAIGEDLWKDKRGASIEYVQQSQSVVVRQTFSAHEKVVDVLQNRRRAAAKPK
jgi:hypothetical protein